MLRLLQPLQLSRALLQGQQLWLELLLEGEQLAGRVCSSSSSQQGQLLGLLHLLSLLGRSSSGHSIGSGGRVTGSRAAW